MMPPSRILVCAESAPPGEDLCRLLEQAGYAVARCSLESAAIEPAAVHLVLLEGSGRDRKALQLCGQLRVRLAEQFVPILFVLDDPSPAWRLASLEAGADTYLLRPFAPGELLGQVEAFLRLKAMHDRLGEKTEEVRRVNQRLQQTYQRMDAELELARRIQRSFLPHKLPEMGAIRFAVHYRPCERVGGDFYDVFRLDEEHVGFYVADAMGHGMPASLLTIFIKKGVRSKEIFGSQYRLVPPEEVLQLLNRDMIDQALSETPFITMVYGLFHARSRSLSFARAGHPYPIYLPGSGDATFWQLPGSLLGVFDTSFPVQTHMLHPGDKVLLYTDGLCGVVQEGQAPTGDTVLACAARHRSSPVEEFVTRVAEELATSPGPQDDVTVLGLEIT